MDTKGEVSEVAVVREMDQLVELILECHSGTCGIPVDRVTHLWEERVVLLPFEKRCEMRMKLLDALMHLAGKMKLKHDLLNHPAPSARKCGQTNMHRVLGQEDAAGVHRGDEDIHTWTGPQCLN